MSDNWYYAEGNKSVGPISLADLAAILSRVSDARNVLVWRDSFKSWEKAETVPELVPYVIKPPPLPISPPPIPQEIIAPSPSPTIIGEPSKTVKEDLVGIGGWLILVAIGQILGPLKLIVGLFIYYTKLDSKLWTMYPITFYGEAVLNISLLALIGYTTNLFFTKSKLFPTFFIYECAASILLFPVDAIFTTATLSAYTGQSTETIIARIATPDQVGQWIATIIAGAIWIAYIKKSKRVANTFLEPMIGRSALPRRAGMSGEQRTSAVVNPALDPNNPIFDPFDGLPTGSRVQRHFMRRVAFLPDGTVFGETDGGPHQFSSFEEWRRSIGK
jgi:hypothetical protein